ncbi:p53-like transcription factor, partial [Melanomma pulvis-pyrius CBS 109.77]
MPPYGSQCGEPIGEPLFQPQKSWYIITCRGMKVTPTISAEIRGRFYDTSDLKWDTYRQNFFAVQAAYKLDPWITNSELYLHQGSGQELKQINSMAVSLTATDRSGRKNIELVQFVPGRKKLAPMIPKKELLKPMPADKYDDPKYQQFFDRIQFRYSTPNNREDRSQGYYSLVVTLWANVRSPRDANPIWIKIGARFSYPIIVYGRPLAYYQKHCPTNTDTVRGSDSYSFGSPGHPVPESMGELPRSQEKNGM